MNRDKLEYESPKLYLIADEFEDVITSSPDFDGGQSGLNF